MLIAADANQAGGGVRTPPSRCPETFRVFLCEVSSYYSCTIHLSLDPSVPLKHAVRFQISGHLSLLQFHNERDSDWKYLLRLKITEGPGYLRLSAELQT